VKSLSNSHLHIWVGALIIILFPVLPLFSETTVEVIIDLRADVNRDGVVDLADPADDENEDIWDSNQGAIFLPNIDDDQSACPATGTDEALAGCNDAADGSVNGNDDLLDMARLLVAPSPQAPNDASGILSASAPGSGYIRIFKNNSGTFEIFPLPGDLTAADLRSGVEFAIEAVDFVRDDGNWNGSVDITLSVDAGTGPGGPLPDGNDTVRMRVSPIIFHHNLQSSQTVYVTAFSSTASIDFRTDLAAACTAAGIPNPVHEFWGISDQHTQDFFETAYMSMPGQGGPHVVRVNFRSANYTGSGPLRSAGRVVFTELRGPDVAGAVEYDPTHTDWMDTLNSFGNFSTIPPYSYGDQHWPQGRIIRGGNPGFYPDQQFDLMAKSQGIQKDIVYIDTENFLVGHINETFNFIKVDSPRGWAVLVADPLLAWTMLQEQYNAGYGNVLMFEGMYWSAGVSAEVTIAQVLSDSDLYNANSWAVAVIDSQIAQLKAATGLTVDEFIPVPALFWEKYSWLASFLPAMTNGFVLTDTHYAAPDPHGPIINSQDIFKTRFADTLSSHGITVHWVENWDLYHRLDGSLRGGVNASRTTPADFQWWDDPYSYKCYGINSDDDNVCSGHGTCLGPDNCDCDQGWAGNICEKCYYKLRGDINEDCTVDFSDIAHLAATWLIDCIADPNNPECLPPE